MINELRSFQNEAKLKRGFHRWVVRVLAREVDERKKKIRRESG